MWSMHTWETDLRIGGMEEREGGMKGESSMETYMLPYVKQTASGNFPYDSGNSNWSSVTI